MKRFGFRLLRRWPQRLYHLSWWIIRVGERVRHWSDTSAVALGRWRQP